MWSVSLSFSLLELNGPLRIWILRVGVSHVEGPQDSRFIRTRAIAWKCLWWHWNDIMTKETLPSLSVKIQRSSHQTLGAAPHVIMKNISTYRRPGMLYKSVGDAFEKSQHISILRNFNQSRYTTMSIRLPSTNNGSMFHHCKRLLTVDLQLFTPCMLKSCQSVLPSMSQHSPKTLRFSKSDQVQLASVWINCLKRDCLKISRPNLSNKNITAPLDHQKSYMPLPQKAS